MEKIEETPGQASVSRRGFHPADAGLHPRSQIRLLPDYSRYDIPAGFENRRA